MCATMRAQHVFEIKMLQSMIVVFQHLENILTSLCKATGYSGLVVVPESGCKLALISTNQYTMFSKKILKYTCWCSGRASGNYGPITVNGTEVNTKTFVLITSARSGADAGHITVTPTAFRRAWWHSAGLGILHKYTAILTRPLAL